MAKYCIGGMGRKKSSRTHKKTFETSLTKAKCRLTFASPI